MAQFIEKYRRLLQAFCIIARILGVLLLLGSAIWLLSFIKCLETIPSDKIRTSENAQELFRVITYIAMSVLYDFIIPGFLAFAIAGLLDFLIRPGAKPRLFLRITDKLCYLFAAFVILKAYSLKFWFGRLSFVETPEILNSFQTLLMQSILVPTLAKVLLLIGIGMILHRLLPVIEESKTLV